MVDTRNQAAPGQQQPDPPGPSRRRPIVVLVAAGCVLALVAVVAFVVRGNGSPASPITTGAAPLDPAAASIGSARGWPLVADDEFDGDAIDRSHWDVYHGRTTGDVGKQSPSAVSVADGTLQITAHGDTSGGLSWDNGQTYGRWEARVKVQPAAGYGPVVLLWPDSGKWPQDGEIDFMEVPQPQRTVNHVTVHYGDDNTQDSTSQNGDFSQWHDYAVEWEADHITAWIDGKQVFTTTNAAEIPHGPMHLAIQQDIGPIDDWIPAPDASTPSTVKLDVDWVHVYGP